MSDSKAKKYGVYDQDAATGAAGKPDAAQRKGMPWVWIAAAIVLLVIIAMIAF